MPGMLNPSMNLSTSAGDGAHSAASGQQGQMIEALKIVATDSHNKQADIVVFLPGKDCRTLAGTVDTLAKNTRGKVRTAYLHNESSGRNLKLQKTNGAVALWIPIDRMNVDASTVYESWFERNVVRGQPHVIAIQTHIDDIDDSSDSSEYDF